MRTPLIASAALALALAGCTRTASLGQPPASPVAAQPTNNQRCEEDQPCWDCHTMGNHVCGRAKPGWLSCSTIVETAGYEFPKLAGRAAVICMQNAGTLPPLAGATVAQQERIERARFVWVGRYDGHRNVWAMVGDTTVFVTKGWFETS